MIKSLKEGRGKTQEIIRLQGYVNTMGKRGDQIMVHTNLRKEKNEQDMEGRMTKNISHEMDNARRNEEET